MRMWYHKVNEIVFAVAKIIEKEFGGIGVPIAMAIAMKPISHPPFPVEKIEEMTKMMGAKIA